MSQNSDDSWKTHSLDNFDNIKSGQSYVIKRDGKKQPVFFDKITIRLNNLCTNIQPVISLKDVDTVAIAQKVIMGLYPGIQTTQLDNLAAETAAYMITQHPAYGDLAARIAISNLQKQAPQTFIEAMDLEYRNVRNKTTAPLLSDEAYEFMKKHQKKIHESIVPERDFGYDYFGFKTLEKTYLVKVNDRIVETPQYLIMRVSIGIHLDDIDAAIETYHLMSQRIFTHATPTLFNSATRFPQMSSCFLADMVDDSIDGIYTTLKRCAMISKSAGGIGLSVHRIRATNSYINGTNGHSNGLVPMLRVFNDTARYVDQGGGKRKGAFAVYLEPWHADIFEFLNLKKNTGKEELRARDLFYGLWIPDLFMERVENNSHWSLFCPNEAKGLYDVWGDEFEKLYVKYEQEGLARKTINAQDLWFFILETQMETGTPYMLYKDNVNKKSNHQHLGVIKSSNLCTEITEYTSRDEVAVCNLASLALPMFVKEDKRFDFQRLFDITKIVTKNLNKIIDINYYPLKEARNSNLRHRPIGIGIQGLADVFIKMRFPYESQEASELNKDIFETIYFAALTASNELAQQYGHYESYPGSPVSKGILQPDMWNVTPSDRWDWTELREKIKKWGLRNSLLTAPMPTASTAQILRNHESFEPYLTNIFTRRVLAGEFTVVCTPLVQDLQNLGLWNSDMRNMIIANGGSIQSIREIPQHIKDLYKTAWEIKMIKYIDMAADRGPFIDQSQSLNMYMAQPNHAKMTTMHFYSWKKGLKTGMYYLRTRPAADAIQFTVDMEKIKKYNDDAEKSACKYDPNDPNSKCTSCDC